MGIKNLFNFLKENSPLALRETKLEGFTGRTLCIDASMAMYQFLVAVRTAEHGANFHQNLYNENGEVTSHIMGFTSRALKMMEAGIRPVFVFDGKPPEAKSGELEKRKEKKDEAEEELRKAQEAGDEDGIKKYAGRSIKITQKMFDDTKTLLELMGCVVIQAPCEAEATCAELVKKGLCYGAVTEDADILTFGCPIMVKNLFKSDATRVCYEVNYKRMLEQLDITPEQFIDFCILCGCDYMSTIRNVGPSTAFKLVKDHGGIDQILSTPDALTDRHHVPEDFPYEYVRELFKKPEVLDIQSLDTIKADLDGFKAFLGVNGFSELSISRYSERLQKTQTSKRQLPLDAFFKRVERPIDSKQKFDPNATKRRRKQ
jgi:flap endonuclease-1